MSANEAFLGTGHLTLIPGGSNPTPIQVARLKDVSVKFTKETRDLEADRVAAIDRAWVGLTTKMTAKNVEWNADAVAAILSGAATVGTGRLIGIDAESGTIPTTPFQITVANTTGHVNLGVTNITKGLAAGVKKTMDRVASAPATGQYSVSAGVYTFAAADVGDVVHVRYYYSNASTGKTATIVNIAPRLDPSFICTLFNTNAAGKDCGFRFVNAHVPDFGLSFKTKDWNDVDVTIDCLGDDSDAIGAIYRS